MQDAFEPRSEPAKSIFRAFQNEAAKRKNRCVGTSVTAERHAVLNTAALQAQKLGLRSPTMAEVEMAERTASGSANYGAKWAHGVVDAMLKVV